MAKKVLTSSESGADSLSDINANYTELYDGQVIVQADEKTTPVDADLVGLIDNVSGLLVNLTWANLKATLKTYFDSVTTTLTNKTITSPVIKAWDGWNTVSDTWAYASATTITVPTGAASLYSKGDKIKLTQTTAKYFYVIAVTDTVLTVTAGTTYTVANAAISEASISHQEVPVGFPQWLTWTPSFTNIGAGASVVSGSFNIKGKTIHYKAGITIGVGGGVFGSITCNLPVTAIGTVLATAILKDVTGLFYNAIHYNGGTIFSLGTSSAYTAISATAPFTWAVGDIVEIQGTYEL